jgi:type II secretory pathway pseudopilin PulG
MKSVTCSSCGLVGWAEGGNCKRCDQPLVFNQPPLNPPPPPRESRAHQSPPPPPPYQSSPPPHDFNAAPNFGGAHNYYGAPNYYGAAQTKKRMGHAIASLAIGVVGLFSLGILLIGSIVGTILGIVALKKEGSDPARYGGKGVAISGIVLNIVAVLTIIPFALVASIAIPNLLASRRAANESSAIYSLRKILSAEGTYQATTGAGSFGSMNALVAAGLIDEEMSRGTKHGYNFVLKITDRGFEAVATPTTYPSSGMRSFYVSEDGEIHVGLNGGLPATANDPTLDAYDSFRDPAFPQRRVRQSQQPGLTPQPALLPGR